MVEFQVVVVSNSEAQPMGSIRMCTHQTILWCCIPKGCGIERLEKREENTSQVNGYEKLIERKLLKRHRKTYR